MKKSLIAAALVASLALVACNDDGDPTAAPTTPAEAVESMAAEAQDAVESMAADAVDDAQDAVESMAADAEDAVDAVESATP